MKNSRHTLQRVKWSEYDIKALSKSYSRYPYQIPKWLIEKHGAGSCYIKAYKLKLSTDIRHPGIDTSRFSETDKGYIAAFLDGEGSILFYQDRKKLNPALYFANTHQGVLKYLQKKLTIGSLAITRRTYKNPKYKDLFQLHIHGAKQVYDILKAIEPYLIIKRDKAQEAIRLLKEKYRFN